MTDRTTLVARTHISTTVDTALLDDTRRLHGGVSDAELIDDALTALLSHHRAAEIDDASRRPDTNRGDTTMNQPGGHEAR